MDEWEWLHIPALEKVRERKWEEIKSCPGRLVTSAGTHTRTHAGSCGGPSGLLPAMAAAASS